MAGGNKIKAAYIPVNERGWLIGYAELMGYLGVRTTDKLNRDYIDKGLIPHVTDDGMNRWKCMEVDKWLEDHNVLKNMTKMPRKRYTKKEIVL